jgi:hypothetical protein
MRPASPWLAPPPNAKVMRRRRHRSKTDPQRRLVRRFVRPFSLLWRVLGSSWSAPPSGCASQDRAPSSSLPAGRPSPRARRGWTALRNGRLLSTARRPGLVPAGVGRLPRAAGGSLNRPFHRSDDRTRVLRGGSAFTCAANSSAQIRRPCRQPVFGRNFAANWADL